MRPRNVILAELAKQTKKFEPGKMMPLYTIAILEVLLDIRDLLRRRQRPAAQSPAE